MSDTIASTRLLEPVSDAGSAEAHPAPVPSVQPSWVSRQLRNFVVITHTLAVLYLALVEGNASAVAGLIAAWTWSAGGMFQERAALKTPGKDA